MHGHTDQTSAQIKGQHCDWMMAYPEDEVDGGEGQAAGEADWAASHKARPCCLQPPTLLHIPQGLSLGALLEAQPCTTQSFASPARGHLTLQPSGAAALLHCHEIQSGNSSRPCTTQKSQLKSTKGFDMLTICRPGWLFAALPSLPPIVYCLLPPSSCTVHHLLPHLIPIYAMHLCRRCLQGLCTNF